MLSLHVRTDGAPAGPGCPLPRRAPRPRRIPNQAGSPLWGPTTRAPGSLRLVREVRASRRARSGRRHGTGGRRRLVPDRPARYANCCEKWSTRARAPATASGGTTGGTSVSAPAAGALRLAPETANPGGDAARAPLSIATASKPRTVTPTGGPIEVERRRVRTAQALGMGCQGSEAGSRGSGSGPGSHRGCERIDRSRLGVGVRFLLRCSPTLRA
jgi:hypothetical protein